MSEGVNGACVRQKREKMTEERMKSKAACACWFFAPAQHLTPAVSF